MSVRAYRHLFETTIAGALTIKQPGYWIETAAPKVSTKLFIGPPSLCGAGYTSFLWQQGFIAFFIKRGLLLIISIGSISTFTQMACIIAHDEGFGHTVWNCRSRSAHPLL